MKQMTTARAAVLASIVTAAIILALPSGARADAADNWDAIAQCAAIADADSRHICLDAVLRGAGLLGESGRTATEAGDTQTDKTSIPEAAAPQAAPKAADTPNDPAPDTKRESADLTQEQRDSFFPEKKSEKEKKAEVKDIEVTLARVQEGPHDKYVLTDTDGVTWRQLYTRPNRVPPEPGQSMTVHKKSLGGYLCRVEKSPSFRCKPSY